MLKINLSLATSQPGAMPCHRNYARARYRGHRRLRLGSLIGTIAIVLALFSLSSPGIAAEPPKTKELKVPQFVAKRLVTNTLIALHQANITGNYTVLRDLGSFNFYLSNNPVILSDKFKPLRENKIDLGVSANVDPVFTSDIKVLPGNALRIAGFYPTNPSVLTFDIVFKRERAAWLVHNIALGTKPAAKKQ